MWAFALVANQSLNLTDFSSRSIAASNTSGLASIRKSKVLRNALRKVKSNGASGFIEFGDSQEVKSAVEIYQVREGRSKVFVALYTLQFWCFVNGTNVILVTLSARLFRIDRISISFLPLYRKFLSDKYLLFCISLLCSPMLVLLVIQSIVDPFTHKFILSAKPLTCSSISHHTLLCRWVALFFSLIGVAMIFAIFFAAQTCHIKHKHFKDTKKVSMFIFTVCIVYAVFIPLRLILEVVDADMWDYVCDLIAHLGGAVLYFCFCQRSFAQS